MFQTFYVVMLMFIMVKYYRHTLCFVTVLVFIFITVTYQRVDLIEALNLTFENTKSSKTEINADQKCKLWQFQSAVKTYENPQIKLNPDLFLYPGLLAGPNNQIVGLLHSMYLAIRLNRLVIFLWLVYKELDSSEQ